uniref:Retrovirus-related Pol polyprotein from type-1 retrotransposable element R1 n=1 Tax=Melanaphis sacchari TaxID=742174 RepID=A0A2H8TV83_9HEMI
MLSAIKRARVRVRLDAPGNVRKQKRIISIAAWQARWDRSDRGRWTHRLLPDVGRWLTKPPLTLTFRLTQMLSEHGCYRSYLERFNRADDSYCVYCPDPDDTVEHTVFICPRWLDDRARMTKIMRRSPNVGDVEEILCGPLPHALPEDAEARRRISKQAETNRLEFIRMVETILSTKEKDEHEDEALQRAQGNVRTARL